MGKKTFLITIEEEQEAALRRLLAKVPGVSRMEAGDQDGFEISKDDQDALNAGLDDFEKGNIISLEEFKARNRKWASG